VASSGSPRRSDPLLGASEADAARGGLGSLGVRRSDQRTPTRPAGFSLYDRVLGASFAT